jgi:hypothetical protein
MWMTRNGSGWDDFVAQHRSIWDESPFELKFVELVLRRVPNLSPSIVRPQAPFTAASGLRHRMDFAIVEEPYVHIALEVDGWDKTGRGTGMTQEEFGAFLQRQSELTSQRWDLLRFSNRTFMTSPLSQARFIDLVLRNSRAVASERNRAIHTAASTISEGERQELAALRAEMEAETRRLRAENDRMGRVSLAMGVVFAGALVAIAIVLSGRANNPDGIPQRTVGSAVTPAQSRMPAASPGVAPVRGVCPSTHMIKGNVSLQGERIYHVPGGEFYSQTTPERCFATAADAAAEGFRKSLR